MQRTSNEILSIKPGFCIALCVAILVVPVQWLISWVCAAMIHELGHYLMLKILKIQICSISIGLSGAVIRTGQMTLKQELLSALAGPLLGFCSMGLARWLPYIAICALIQNVYNILPLPGHDGSRVLKCFLGLLLTESVAEAVLVAVRVFVLILLVGICLYLATRVSFGYLLMWFAVGVALKCFLVKIPCKDRKQIVQ